MTSTKFIARLFPALLILALLLSLPTMAAEPLGANGDTQSESTQWHFDPVTGSLTAAYPARWSQPASTATYHTHDLEGTPAWSRLLIAERDTSYTYLNAVEILNNRYTLYAHHYTADVVLMSENTSDGPVIPFFTDDSAARITALLNGSGVTGHILRTPSGSTHRAITSERLTGTWNALLDELAAAQASNASLTLSLRELRFFDPDVIYAMTTPTWFSVPTHFLYDLQGTRYVLPAASLPDSCFSAGTLNTSLATEVTLYPLSEEAVEDLDSLLEKAQRDRVEYTSEALDIYEYNRDNQDPSGDISIMDRLGVSVMMVSVVFCGIIVPIAPITVGLIKGLSRSNPHNRRWLWLVLSGATWLLLGILLLLLLAV